jgi:phosphohistidine phosphatase
VKLLIVRHGPAGDPEEWEQQGKDDRLRPLTPKGKKEVRKAAAGLVRLLPALDLIATSPWLRAAQTAEIVASQLGVAVREDDRLAGPLDLDTVDGVLARAEDPQRAVLVGHDPDFSELLSLLCDAENAAMRKGALARIEVDRPLKAGGGTLRWLIPPDALKPER